MVKKYFLLDEDDQLALKQLIAREKVQILNRPNRVSWQDGIDYLAPEVFIGKPQSTISAMSTTDVDYGLPGYGQCDVYQIQLNSSGLPELLRVYGLEEKVHNFGSASMSSSNYIIFMRDKFGSFIPVVASSSSLDVRSFTLRTDLNPGYPAVAQWTEYRTVDSGTGTGTGTSDSIKQLCWHLNSEGDPVYFWVYDRLQEFYGYEDRTCGYAWRLTDTPNTLEELGIEGDPGAYAINDTSLYEILRVTCPDFIGCPCRDKDIDPCSSTGT